MSRSVLMAMVLSMAAAGCVEEEAPLDEEVQAVVDEEATVPAPAPALPAWPLPPFVPAPLCGNGQTAGGMQNVAGVTCEAAPARGTNLCCDTRPNLRYPAGLVCVIGLNRPAPWGECVDPLAGPVPVPPWPPGPAPQPQPSPVVVAADAEAASIRATAREAR